MKPVGLVLMGIYVLTALVIIAGILTIGWLLWQLLIALLALVASLV